MAALIILLILAIGVIGSLVEGGTLFVGNLFKENDATYTKRFDITDIIGPTNS